MNNDSPQIFQHLPRLQFYDKLGSLVSGLSDQEVFDSLQVQVDRLRELLSTTAPPSLFAHDAVHLTSTFMEMYFSFKLAKHHYSQQRSECPDFSQHLKHFFSLYEELLKPVPRSFEQFAILVALSFLLLAMHDFSPAEESIGEGFCGGLKLLLSSAEPEYISRACQLILPGPQLATLFVKTLAHEFVMLEQHYTADPRVSRAVRLMADIITAKYGKLVAHDFSDELYTAYNTYDYFQCAALLWENATGPGDHVLTGFGRSFLVTSVKNQWAIIRQSMVFAPDLSTHILYVDGALQHEYFEYTAIMFGRLFALLQKLDWLSTSNPMSGSVLALNADKMLLVYADMNQCLERLVTSLMDFYEVILHSSAVPLDHKARIEIIRSVKFTALLGSYTLALTRKILIGPMGKFSLQPISPIVEKYVRTCDYSFLLLPMKPLPGFFYNSLQAVELSLYENYPFLMALDDNVKRFMNNTRHPVPGSRMNYVKMCLAIAMALCVSWLITRSYF